MSKGKGGGEEDRDFAVLDRFSDGIACKCCAAAQKGRATLQERAAPAAAARDEDSPKELGRLRRAAAAK